MDIRELIELLEYEFPQPDFNVGCSQEGYVWVSRESGGHPAKLGLNDLDEPFTKKGLIEWVREQLDRQW